MFKYLRWSNLKISFDLSPFVWTIKWISDYDKVVDIWFWYFRLGPLSFLLVLDDGSFQNDNKTSNERIIN